MVLLGSEHATAVAAWVALVVGCFIDIAGATFMNESDGFTNVRSTVLAFVTINSTATLTIVALSHIDLSIVWPMMAGVELIGASAMGIFFFREPLTIVKLVALIMILVGVLALAFTEEDVRSPWPASWDVPLWPIEVDHKDQTDSTEELSKAHSNLV